MKIKIDPVTRIEGHLSVTLDMADGKVSAAFCSGTMFRGFEMFLRGRDPLDAVQLTQRICGVCPVDHGVAASLALEAALGVQLPPNGRRLRNLLLGASHIQSHLLHFYQLSALDFVDITAVLQYSGRDQRLQGVRDWVKAQLPNKAVNPAAPFLPRYDGDYMTDVDLNLGAVDHYLQALQKHQLAQEMLSIFGGKMPHATALVPGGVTARPTVDNVEAYRARLQELRAFIDTVYLPDVVAVAQAYPQHFQTGRGPASFLAYGAFPEDEGGRAKLLPGGAYLNGQVVPLDISLIREETAATWLNTGPGLSPARGQTTPQPDKTGAYSWVKAPRYDGEVMEVGPLARVLITHLSGANPALSTLLTNTLQQLNLSVSSLFSTLGRHLARAVECKVVADRCAAWLDELELDQPTVSASYQITAAGSGVGLTEAARGALGHWLDISNRAISHYECVVPTTWNCSPRDDRGQPGALEQALEGLVLANQEQPIEAVRVVHAFDPCLACAVH